MKFKVSLLTALILLIASCSEERDISYQEKQSLIVDDYRILPDKDKKFFDILNENYDSKIIDKFRDNYFVQKVVEVKDITGNSTFVLQNKSNTNLYLGVQYDQKDNKFTFQKMTSIKKQNGIIKNTYINNNYQTQILINTELEKINVNTLRVSTAKCGQETMDCITDIYSEQGWASVAGWVLTAFQPEVALAVAAGCGASECADDVAELFE